MPGDLLLKARIYPISLVEIANRYKPRLEFSRDNYNTWKVEIAVGALSSLLDELWKTRKALLMYEQKLPQQFQATGHDPNLIRANWQALVPLALAVHLHGDFPSPEERAGVDLGELFKEKLKSAIAAVKSVGVSDAEASTAINQFLSLFREWAESVAQNPSERKDYNDILREVDSKLGNVFPPQEVRRHIAAFASDLLRLVSVTEKELRTSFQDPINDFFNQVKGAYVSYLQRDVWFNMSPFDSINDENIKQFSFEFFPWILIVRYYLNKMTGNVQGSLWRQLMEDPNKTLGAGAAWGSNLPALLWGSLYPSQRAEESPNDENFAKEALSRPSAVAPHISGATTTGKAKLTNLSLATEVASDVSVLLTGVPLGTAEIHRRNYPGQLKGVVVCLKDVLNFIQGSLESSADPVATLKTIIENPGNPTLSSFLESLLDITSLDSVDEGQVNKFKQILKEKVKRLEALEGDYSRQQDLLGQAWAFISEFGEIIGRTVQFHEDVDRMIEDIFRMLVEVTANYRGSEWRRALWPLSSRAFRFFGSPMAMYGVPTNKSEATGPLEGVEGSRAAALRFVDTVINTTTSLPQEDKDLFKRLVDAIKELYRLLRSTDVVINKRAFLGISSSLWEQELDRQLEEIGLSVEEIVESVNVEDLYEQAKEFITREKLEKIFSWFKDIVVEAWKRLAKGAAKRVSQVVKGLSLTTMPSGKLAEWLRTLFRAARVEQWREVPIAEEFPREGFEEGEEAPVILEAPRILSIEEIEGALSKILEGLASAHKGIGNIATPLENFAQAWDTYVAEVGRGEITINSPKFGEMVGRVLKELLMEKKVHKEFVEDFVKWLREVKGCPIVGLENFPLLQEKVKKEVGVKEPPSGEVEVGEGPETPFGPEGSTSASQASHDLEQEGSSGPPYGSSEPPESEEEKKEEEEERRLLLKFVFLAKALRVFP
jgi:hypothetical protein